MSDVLTPQQQDDLYLPKLSTVREALIEGYSPELEFHAPEHEAAVFERANANRQLLLTREVEGIPGAFVTGVSASGHDTGFNDYFSFGLKWKYGSAEAYAARLTDEVLVREKVDKQTRKEVHDNIFATKAGVRSRTWGQFILCEADLHNTTGDYDTDMAPNTNKLRAEFARLTGTDLGDIGYKLFSLRLLATYHQVNLNFSRIATAGGDFIALRDQMGTNLRKMLEEIASQTGEQMFELVKRIGGPALRLFGVSKSES